MSLSCASQHRIFCRACSNLCLGFAFHVTCAGMHVTYDLASWRSVSLYLGSYRSTDALQRPTLQVDTSMFGAILRSSRFLAQGNMALESRSQIPPPNSCCCAECLPQAEPSRQGDRPAQTHGSYAHVHHSHVNAHIDVTQNSSQENQLTCGGTVGVIPHVFR